MYTHHNLYHVAANKQQTIGGSALSSTRTNTATTTVKLPVATNNPPSFNLERWREQIRFADIRQLYTVRHI